MSDERLDAFWLGHAYQMATLSPDPSTQNGAVIARGETMLGHGCNRFPNGIANTDERWENTALRYQYVAHAEESACANALLVHGGNVRGATLYSPWYACTDCAKTILLTSISRVVGHADMRDYAERYTPGWTDSIALALDMLAEAGVQCDWYRGRVPDAPSVRVGGRLFAPANL